MYYFFIYFFLFIIISLLIMKISIMISMKLKLNLEKMSPFECGFNPFFMKRMPFSLRFFLISVIFLIFDIEIALLLPLIYSMNFSNKIIWLNSSICLIMILIIGLFYEWKNGALNWI